MIDLVFLSLVFRILFHEKEQLGKNVFCKTVFGRLFFTKMSVFRGELTIEAKEERYAGTLFQIILWNDDICFDQRLWHKNVQPTLKELFVAERKIRENLFSRDKSCDFCHSFFLRQFLPLRLHEGRWSMFWLKPLYTKSGIIHRTRYLPSEGIEECISVTSKLQEVWLEINSTFC